MIEKDFITQEMIRDASLKLAEKMYKEDGFFPDIIYDSLRGGAYMANVISEYYKIVGKKIGSWLYSEDLDGRRRISTKGARILGEIDGASVYSVRALIADHKKEVAAIQRSENLIARRLYQINSLMRDIEYMKALVSGTDEPPYVESLQDNAEKLKEFLQSSAQKTDEVVMRSEKRFYERLYSLCKTVLT